MQNQTLERTFFSYRTFGFIWSQIQHNDYSYLKYLTNIVLIPMIQYKKRYAWEIITEIENSHHQSNVANLYSWTNLQLLIQAA
jgi:hypothetical protein